MIYLLISYKSYLHKFDFDVSPWNIEIKNHNVLVNQ